MIRTESRLHFPRTQRKYRVKKEWLQFTDELFVCCYDNGSVMKGGADRVTGHIHGDVPSPYRPNALRGGKEFRCTKSKRQYCMDCAADCTKVP